MANCKWCGRSGLLLRVTENGLCSRCNDGIVSDVMKRGQEIIGSYKAIKNSKNADDVLLQYELILEHAQALLQYERKGIPTIEPLPSLLLKRHVMERDEYITQALNHEFESLERGLFKLKTARGKINRITGFVDRLEEFKMRMHNPSMLDVIREQLVWLAEASQTEFHHPSKHASGEEFVENWVKRNETLLGITREHFDSQRQVLSREFGVEASINDTLWRILNNCVVKYAHDTSRLEHVYVEMAQIVAWEGKDPSQYLAEANRIGRGLHAFSVDGVIREFEMFMGHEELAQVRKMRKENKLDDADALLMKAWPSPAVLDELRKNASIRARNAKKRGDWETVIKYLEGYNQYAYRWKKHCTATVNQAPPRHTDQDRRLLEQAKEYMK